MGLTNENVIERSLSEIYEAGGVARPSFDFLEGAITIGATSLVLEGKANFVPEFSLLEFYDSSMEIAEAGDVDGTTVPLLTRGYLETTAAAHSDAVRVVLDPPYPRQVLLNALKAVIGQLYPTLFREAYTTTLTYSNTAPVQLPSGALDVLAVLVQNGSNWFPLTEGQNFRVFPNYSGLATAPALQFFGGGIPGNTMRVLYRADFDTDPFALTTNLDDVGIPDTLQPALPLGLAGWVLMGRDVSLVESEHIRPDPQNPAQIGSRYSIGRTLWNQFWQGPVYTAHQRLRVQYPTLTMAG